MHWYLRALKNYADFSGRARRKEYWTFVLVNTLLASVYLLVEFVIPDQDVVLVASMLTLAFSLAVFLPELAVTTRRLHDKNRSGWWLLFQIVPIVGPLALLVWLASDGDSGPNQYGPDPKREDESAGAITSGADVPVARRRVRWIVPAAVVMAIALATGGFLYLTDLGPAEADALSACTAIAAYPEEVASVDLASLGLRASGLLEARSIYGDGFADGAVVQYVAGGSPAALVAALRYANNADAASAFSGFQEWAEGNCGRSSWMNSGARGVIHCYYSDGHDMFVWSDNWILDIEATDVNGLPAAELVTRIKDAVLSHWQALQTWSIESL